MGYVHVQRTAPSPQLAREAPVLYVRWDSKHSKEPVMTALGRLSIRLFVLFLVFSAFVSLVPYGLYSGSWGWSIVGAGILLAFIVLGGLLVPPVQKTMSSDEKKIASALLQSFGAFCGLEFLIMALLLWIYGNRSYADSNGYLTVGLLIFLALLGVGIMGALGAFVRFFYVYNLAAIERRQSGGHS
jgi:hypothetical protein